MRDGGWARDEVEGIELAGHTLGIVGLGGIGTRVGRLAGALDMRVLAWTRNPEPQRLAAARAEYAPLEELVARSDIVSLHLARTPETTGIISGALLARMRPDAYLVNTAGGELVDEGALVAALRERRIAGAALDVFSSEPPPPDHPLRSLPNVILTPHVGYRTPEATRRSIAIAIDNLIGIAAGELRNVVN
jgi:D-3-phosphoglycerate dehydrogenase